MNNGKGMVLGFFGGGKFFVSKSFFNFKEIGTALFKDENVASLVASMLVAPLCFLPMDGFEVMGSFLV